MSFTWHLEKSASGGEKTAGKEDIRSRWERGFYWSQERLPQGKANLSARIDTCGTAQKKRGDFFWGQEKKERMKKGETIHRITKKYVNFL